MLLKSLRTRIFVVVLSALLLVGAGAAYSSIALAQETTAPESAATIYQDVSPSVVAIAVEKQVTGITQVFPNMRHNNSQENPQVERALGSGFVYDTDGHIITNAHVVEGATSVEVDFNDGTLARAEIVGIDSDSDLAVIQVQDVPAEKLHPVTFANSDELYVGQDVLAIGSPFGERWTLTTGIISGIDRLIQGLNNYSIAGVIQTDAAINPGNSGGPLLNTNGEVVGVNAQILSSSGANSGIGFAIPSNLVQRVAQQLIDTGSVEYSYLGISGGDVNLQVIEALSLPNDTRGVVVGTIAESSPAADAGLEAAVFSDNQDAELQSADIITAIDGHSLYGIADLISYLTTETKPGDSVTLTVLRNGTDEISLDVTLIARPHNAQS